VNPQQKMQEVILEKWMADVKKHPLSAFIVNLKG
jgi:hypothetical protein